MAIEVERSFDKGKPYIGYFLVNHFLIFDLDIFTFFMIISLFLPLLNTLIQQFADVFLSF